MKRRQFLAVAAAGTASLPVLARGRAWPAMQPAARTGIDHAIFDARFEEARRFGRAMHGLGYAVSPFHGDVTDLWSGYLDVRWRKSADSIAGQTVKECFFCLSQLAVSHGVYPKFWIEHVFNSGGEVSHEINGPADAVGRAAKRLTGTADWTSVTAHLLDSLDLENTSATARHTVHTGMVGSSRDTAGNRDGILVSWVMAPTRQTRLYRQS